MRKLPPLNAVRAFEAAARHVSFTKAGEELHVTHGAISRQVALLEQWLGTALFSRTPSHLQLTDDGRSYLAEITPALDRIAVASMQVQNQSAPTSLRVSAPPTFTMRWLIPRLSGFQRRRPDVEVKLTTSISPVNFNEHGYDIAIRGQDGPLKSCTSRHFMTEIIAPVCHMDLLEDAKISHPRDLSRHTLISYQTEPYAWPDWISAAGLPARFRPAGTLKFEQMYFALQAAAEGLGVVLVPLFLVADDIVAGRLAAPLGMLAAKQRGYYANARGALARHAVVEAFCDWLMREGRDTEQSIAAWAGSRGWTLPRGFPGQS
jgi:LysR family transcriptional regulator, glycine cleavage system transcriptional activator